MALGIDISKISRFEKFIDNEKFYNRIFTKNEIRLIDSKDNKRKLEVISGRFSGKESVAKALGTGIGAVGFKDIEILSEENGKPFVNLYNRAYEIWQEKGLGELEISISHDGDYVFTTVNNKERHMKINSLKEVNNLLKIRSSDSHKGDYGKVALIGGSKGMCGSIYMSSISSLRTGSGLVYTVVPESISNIMEIKSVENIVISVKENNLKDISKLLNKIDAFGIGPGMGNLEEFEYIDYIISNFNKPIIIDADGLNIISENLDRIPKDRNIILTPHEMEMSRLTKLPVPYIHENREKVATDLAKELGVVVVLKGSKTVVTDGIRVYINKTGNSGMATAGSGDILTGIITSLLGQGYNIYDASVLGVSIHGNAGDLAKYKLGEDGMIARDILESIPVAIKIMRENI